MSFGVTFHSENTGSIEKTESVEPSRIHIDKVKSFTSEQIQSFSIQMARQVVDHLCPYQKAAISQKTSLQKGSPLSTAEKMMGAMEITIAQNQKAPIFPEELYEKFVESLSHLFQQKMIEAFSLPSQFLENGLLFSLTGYGPIETLEEALKTINFSLNFSQVPTRYTVYLNGEGLKKFTLVAHHRSEEITFYQQIFY